MNYDEVKIIKYDIDTNYEIGIINGSDSVFYIKADYNESIYGNDNRYVKMALKMNEVCGVSVVVSNTLKDVEDKEQFLTDMEFINNNYNPKEVYAFGINIGANILLSNSYKYKKIVRVLGVNPPFMYNLHLLKDGIRRFKKEKMILLVTKNYPSYIYLESLKKSKKLEIIELDSDDHDFSTNNTMFIDLPFEYLLDKEKNNES